MIKKISAYTGEERKYSADYALNIAELWDSGKMIGGDEDEVIFSLMDEVQRMRKLMNPKIWTKEMHDAWQTNMPNVQKAFDALCKLNT